MLRRIALILLLSAAASMAMQWTNQKKGKSRDTSVRNVEGLVSLPGGSPAVRAVVQLKNVKNLQIRSFITDEAGKYQFQNLSTSIDYELTATHGNFVSPKRTLSVFDTRLDAIVNLQLEPKKDGKDPAKNEDKKPEDKQ
jgi:hypothetical protein